MNVAIGYYAQVLNMYERNDVTLSTKKVEKGTF